MEKLKKEVINKAKKALKTAMDWAKLITTEDTTQNKTRILNAENHLSQFYAYMEVLWEIDIEEYVDLGSKTSREREYVALAIDKLYDLERNENRIRNSNFKGENQYGKRI